MKTDKCFDIGIIQAFTDGELSSDLQEKVIGHIALCDNCANLLTETEEESTFAFSVLDEELNCLVPTERLRTKVFASIKEREEKVSWWQKVTESLGIAEGFSFKSPSLIAFASVVLFVSALGVGLYFNQPIQNVGEVANAGIDGNVPVLDVPNVQSDAGGTPVSHETPINPEIPKNKVETPKPFRVIKAGGIKNNRRNKDFRIHNAQGGRDVKPTVKPRKSTPPSPSPNLSGEDSYLQTIATLNRTVGVNKETLRPAERIAFERDLAVVNDAIKKMKQEVRKNPKNQAAREVLRSSYKNKIDLLNSVAEKTELMASIE